VAEEEYTQEFEDTDDPGEIGWLTTFADLSLLLLVFFVLLFTMSTLDEEMFSKTFSSVNRALSGQLDKLSTSQITQEEAGVILDQVLMQRQLVEAQRKVFSDVKTLQTTKGLEGVISANFEDGLITLQVPGDVLFARGEVDLTPAGKRLVGSLEDFFVSHPDQEIKIIGHTDDVKPQPGGRFRDNWEISAMRAVNVLRYLMSLGIEPGRLTATGLADFDPLVPNSTEENRGKNRRVEFVLEKRVFGD